MFVKTAEIHRRMQNRHHPHGIRVDAIINRVRESTGENTPQSAMGRWKQVRPAANSVKDGIDRPDKICGQAHLLLLVPITGGEHISRSCGSKPDQG